MYSIVGVACTACAALVECRRFVAMPLFVACIITALAMKMYCATPDSQCTLTLAETLKLQQLHPSTQKQASCARYATCVKECFGMLAQALKLLHLHPSTPK